jgi:hypothetical protein
MFVAQGGNQIMKRKMAVITVELVDESIEDANENIAKELITWFREELVMMPWLKQVRTVAVKEQDG